MIKVVHISSPSSLGRSWMCSQELWHWQGIASIIWTVWKEHWWTCPRTGRICHLSNSPLSMGKATPMQVFKHQHGMSHAMPDYLGEMTFYSYWRLSETAPGIIRVLKFHLSGLQALSSTELAKVEFSTPKGELNMVCIPPQTTTPMDIRLRLQLHRQPPSAYQYSTPSMQAQV